MRKNLVYLILRVLIPYVLFSIIMRQEIIELIQTGEIHSQSNKDDFRSLLLLAIVASALIFMSYYRHYLEKKAEVILNYNRYLEEKILNKGISVEEKLSLFSVYIENYNYLVKYFDKVYGRTAYPRIINLLSRELLMIKNDDLYCGYDRQVKIMKSLDLTENHGIMYIKFYTALNEIGSYRLFKASY